MRDELFVNHGERAVRRLNHGNGVVGVADALMEGVATSARISSRMARPAASSAAELTRRPEEKDARLKSQDGSSAFSGYWPCFQP